MSVSGTYVRTSIHVTTRGFVYLANEISRVFLEAIDNLGLDPSNYADDMPVIERGLRTWIALRQLEAAYLEVYDSVSGVVRTRIDLAIVFQDEGKERFETDIETIRRAFIQAGSYPGCAYRVVVSTAPGAVAVSGWSDTTLGSVDHLTSYDIGKVIDTASANANMRVYR